MPPPLSIIEVIYATSIRVSTRCLKGILSITPQQEQEAIDHPRKKLKSSRKKIAFDDDDLEETMQPHDNALVITLRIGGFLMKRVMIDQGSGAI